MPADLKAAFKCQHYVLQIHLVSTLGTCCCPVVFSLDKGTKSPQAMCFPDFHTYSKMTSTLESEAYSNTKCCNFPYLFQSLNNLSCQILKPCLTLLSASYNLNPYKHVPVPIMRKQLYVRVTLLIIPTTKLGGNYSKAVENNQSIQNLGRI